MLIDDSFRLHEAEREGSTKGTCYAIRTPRSGEEVVKAERSEV